MDVKRTISSLNDATPFSTQTKNRNLWAFLELNWPSYRDSTFVHGLFLIRIHIHLSLHRGQLHPKTNRRDEIVFLCPMSVTLSPCFEFQFQVSPACPLSTCLDKIYSKWKSFQPYVCCSSIKQNVFFEILCWGWCCSPWKVSCSSEREHQQVSCCRVAQTELLFFTLITNLILQCDICRRKLSHREHWKGKAPLLCLSGKHLSVLRNHLYTAGIRHLWEEKASATETTLCVFTLLLTVLAMVGLDLLPHSTKKERNKRTKFCLFCCFTCY